MVAVPPLREAEYRLLVTYTVDGDETVGEAISYAFLAANVDIFERDTVLHDWIDTDALDGFDWTEEGSLRVLARIWGHRVVITGDEVSIYRSERGSSQSRRGSA